MDIHYPAGIRPVPSSTKKAKPGKKTLKMKVAPGNRGMGFESAINDTNAYYAEKGLCFITKRPTPINVVKVDYTHGPKITSAYFQAQSTTDYNGVYQGHYIDFEAKETRNKTSFPLHNIPLQQIQHLEQVLAQKGLAFFLIRFVTVGETYFLPAEFIISFYRERPRSSIPLSLIKENGTLIPEGFRPAYDYLPVLIERFLK